MTVIELYDRVPVHNILSCLSLSPESIIFLGEGHTVERTIGFYESFARRLGFRTTFAFQSVNKNDLDDNVNVLCEIVDREGTCMIDLTGGDELALVAAGIVYAKYRQTNKVQLHRINVGNGILRDCDHDKTMPASPVHPQLSVEECIALYGGAVVPYNGRKGTYPWDFNPEFTEDLLCLWEMCRKDPGIWNLAIGAIAVLLDNYARPDDPDHIEGSKYYTQLIMECKNEKRYEQCLDLIRGLSRCGFLTDFYEDDDTLIFGFKNEQIKKCLTKEGTVLELIVYYVAAQNDAGQTRKYNDVRTGVHIDWDGVLEHEDPANDKDTENEIDVIMMKGLTPIFVSCKNGQVDEVELYKLNTVANRFGGPYAKKVIIVSDYARTNADSEKYFLRRAKDMNVIPFLHVADLKLPDLGRILWSISC